METAELSHYKPGRKIRLGLCASFLGYNGAGGHGRPVDSSAKSPAFVAIVGRFAWVSKLTSDVSVRT